MAKQTKKIGRNAPCPCGSGKKYKKCCLEKDQQQEHEKLQQQQTARELAQRNYGDFAEKPDPEDRQLFTDDPTAIPRNDDWEEYDEDWDEDDDFDAPPPERAARWEAPDIKVVPRDDASISEAEMPVINAWWNGFEKLDDLDEIRRYFEDLFTNHPELAHKTDWPDGMFEVGDRYRAQGREAEYIDFLIHIRREWPDLYLPDYGYFDRDIIIYLVIAGRTDDVPEFLNLFREYPSHDPDNLFAVIRYLRLSDCEDVLVPFVRDICHEVCYSPQIISGADVLRPVTLSYWRPYIRPDVSDTELAELAEQMQSIKGPVNENCFKPEFLKEQIDNIVGEFRAWDLADCPTIQDVYTRYYRICQNFMGFLHREKGKGWLMADFLRELLFQYFERVIPKGKRPHEAFGVFTKNKIDRTIVKLGNDMMFLYPARLLGALNAVYYFAEYLSATASVSEERAQEIQAWCREIFAETYPEADRSHPAAEAFKQFPL